MFSFDEKIRNAIVLHSKNIKGIYCQLGKMLNLNEPDMIRIAESDILEFIFTISSADGKLTQKEVDIINLIMSQNYSFDNVSTCINSSEYSTGNQKGILPFLLYRSVEDPGNKVLFGFKPSYILSFDIIATSLMCVDGDVNMDKLKIRDALLNHFYKLANDTGLQSISDTADFQSNDLVTEYKDSLVKVTGDSQIWDLLYYHQYRKKVSPISLYNQKGNAQSNENKAAGNNNKVKADKGEKVTDEENIDSLIAKLNELVGLPRVKQDVNSIINLIKIRNMRLERNLPVIPMSFHLVFTGNPGTGKTTVARLLSKIYKALGLLSKGHMIEVDRSGLVAGYVGQTAIKVKEVIEKANGGILFIDEAYSLSSNRNGDDFGKEAIDTILKAMEDNRDDLIVIAAGYPELMNDFLDSNPGLRSRFNKFINFEDYTPEELLLIFEGMCKKSGYILTDEARDHAVSYFKSETAENFANARGVRNFFENVVSNQANRLAVLDIPTDEALCTITIDDLKTSIDD